MKLFLEVWKLIGSYHSIADEIHEYNTTYWSKFLLNFWLTYGLTVILLLYIALFIYIESITKFISCYVFLAFVTSFLMLILKASSVSHSVKCSHVRIASLYVSYSLHNRHPKTSRLFTKFKLNFQKSLLKIKNASSYFHWWNDWRRRTLDFRVGSYLQSITSALTKSVIFLFIIISMNFFIQFQILSLLSIMFLRIVETIDRNNTYKLTEKI